jgi:hypothetical protein
LKIVIVEGEGARNVVRQIAAKPNVVRIEDVNHRPVNGATITFNAPAVGASGQFENDAATMRTTSDQNGLASPGVFHPNGISGPFQIRVTAEFQGQTAMAIISQTNTTEKTGRRKWIVIGVSVAAAGAAIAFRNKDSGGAPSNVPNITFTGAAVGAPK